MNINCNELKQIVQNDEELKKIILLKEVKWVKYAFQKILDAKQSVTSPEVKQFLDMVYSVHKSFFLIKQNIMSGFWSAIKEEFKKKYIKLLKNIKTKEDLQEIVDNQHKFIKFKNNIKRSLKFMSSTEVDTYLNNIIVAWTYNEYKQSKLIEDFLNKVKDVAKLDDEWIKWLREEIERMTKEVNANKLPFTEWDKLVLSYEWEIDDIGFQKFMRKRERYIDLLQTQAVYNKIKVYQEYKTLIDRLQKIKTALNGLDDTKLNTTWINKTLKYLEQHQEKLWNIIKKWWPKVLDNAISIKIEDAMKSLSVEAVWYNVNLPINKQAKYIEQKIKSILWEWSKVKVSIVDTVGKNSVFKVEINWRIEYVSVKDFKEMVDSLNAINFLGVLDESKKWVVSMNPEKIDIAHRILTDPDSDLITNAAYNIYNAAKWKEAENLLVKTIDVINEEYFWKKIVDFIWWFRMNSELLKDHAPDFYNILLKQTGVSYRLFNWEAEVYIWKIKELIQKNIKAIDDNKWLLILSKYIKVPDDVIDAKEPEQIMNELNNIFNKYKNNITSLYAKLKDKWYLIKQNRDEWTKTVNKYINKFEAWNLINKEWALSKLLYDVSNNLEKNIWIDIGVNLIYAVDKNKEYIEKYIEEVVDKYIDTYKEHFKNLEIQPKDLFTNVIKKYFKGSNNVLVFHRDAAWTYKILDNIFKQLPEYSKDWLIKTEIEKMNIPKWKKENIINWLEWQSAFGHWWFAGMMRNLRKWSYTAQLSRVSPKSYLLAWYNIVSWWVKALTSFSYKTENVKKLWDLLQYMKDEMPDVYDRVIRKLDFFEDWIFKVSEDVIHDWFQHQIDDEQKNIYENLIENTITFLNKNLNTNYKISEAKKKKIASILTGPMPVSDKLTEKIFGIVPHMIEQSMQEHWITVDELQKLVDTIKQAEGDNLSVEIAENQLRDYLRLLKDESTHKYMSFFKVSNTLWLSKNTLSDLWFINYFSAWWSKTIWEFLHQTVWASYRDAIIAASKYPDWNKFATFMKVFTDSLLTSPSFNAFIRQLGYGAKFAYALSKEDKDNNNIDYYDAIIWTTLAKQWWDSNVVTRAIEKAYKWLGYWSQQTQELTPSLEAMAIMSLSEFTWNFFKEFQYSVTPIINWIISYLNDAKKNDDESGLISFVSHVTDVIMASYKNMLATNLWYYLYDKSAWILYERPDAWQGYNILEAVTWIQFTRHSDKNGELKDQAQVAKIIKKWGSAISDLISNWIWYYYWEPNQEKLDKLTASLNKNRDFLSVKNNADIRSFSDDAIDKSYKKLVSNGLLSWWTKRWNNPRLELVFNELKEKWVDIDNVLWLIDAWILKWNAAKQEKLASLWLSKSSYAVLISTLAQQIYKKKKESYKKLYGWITDEQDKELKREIMTEFAPILAKYDKQFHTDLLNIYLTDKYDENELYQYYWTKSKSGSFKRSKVWDYLYLRFLAEVADKADIEWDPELFQNMSAYLLNNIPDEYKAKKIADFFNIIDSFNFIWSKWKNVVKAWILYANRNDIKKLLNSKYADKFKEGANKLADIIWNYWNELKIAPNMLNWLMWQWMSKWNKKKFNLTPVKPYKSPATKIYNWIIELADDIVKMPRYKDIPLKSVMKKIDIALKNIPDIDVKISSPVVEELKQKIHTFKTKTLKTNGLKVKKAKPKHARVRKPSMKAVKPSHKRK